MNWKTHIANAIAKHPSERTEAEQATIAMLAAPPALAAKTRAHRLIKNHIETPGHTLEELFAEIVEQIEKAEQSSYSRGFEAARRKK